MSGSAASVFEGPAGIIPVVNTAGNIYEEVQVATAGQTVFTLLTFQYTPGTKTIIVLKNGVELRRAVGYAETSNTVVTLAAGAALNDVITLRAYAIGTLTAPLQNNGVIPAGTNGQVLAKSSGSDYALQWLSLSSIATLLDQPVQAIASAPTVDVTPYSAVTRNILITGTTQIDGWAITAGQVFLVRFAAALTLSNSASQVTGTGASIRIAPNDSCLVRATANNVVEILLYTTIGGNGVFSSINSGPLAGFKNRLINGNFIVNQLAVASPVTLAAGVYGHDGWKAGAAGCTYSFVTVGLDTVITITAGSLMQVVEDKNIEGGVYTLSNRGTAQARTAINGAVPGGAYASAISQQTVSATGGQTVTVEFTTGTVDRAQLESGTIASTFERRFIGSELLICQRYYEPLPGNSGNAGLFRWYGPGGAGEIRNVFQFKVPKRTTPTISNQSPDFSSNCSATIQDVTATSYNIVMLSSALGTGSFGWLTTAPAASARL